MSQWCNQGHLILGLETSQCLTESRCYKLGVWKQWRFRKKMLWSWIMGSAGSSVIGAWPIQETWPLTLNLSLTNLPTLWKCNIKLPCMYKSKYLNGTKYIFLHCFDQHIHTLRSGLHPGFFLKSHSFPEQGSCSHWALYGDASKLTTWSALFHWKD